MQLRLSVPLALILKATQENDLFPSTEFRRNGALIKVTLSGGDPMQSGEQDEPYFRSIDGYELEIAVPSKVNAQYTRLISSCSYREVAQKLLPIVNRVNRALRNFGWVSNVQEIHRKHVDGALLSKWKARWRSDTTDEWKDIRPPDTFGAAGLLAFLQDIPNSNRRDLSVARWPDIAEAVEQDSPARPEDEFITNALQHLDEGNNRVAAVEAFVCLEIVLAQFLAAFFRIRRGFNDDQLARVRKASLTTKVGVLLEQILSYEERKHHNLDSVLEAYGWRNKIVHIDGHLPRTVSSGRVANGVLETLRLAHALSFKRDEVMAEPEGRKISKGVSERFDLPLPKTILQQRHFVYVEFTFYSPYISQLGAALSGSGTQRQHKREQAIFEQAVAWLCEACRKRDRLFIPESHLTVWFKEGGRRIARFEKGIWVEKLIDQHSSGAAQKT